MAKLRTHWDAVQEGHEEEKVFIALHAKENIAHQQLIAKFTPQENLHPSIGALVNKNGIRYYAYINGTYTEGTPEVLSSLLEREVAA